ncbi:MAG: GNAT family N-acetyltransferase [Clostridia bacterium]|nr:GNAT family N-acetyltransferase [Clostridia bacterium]
MRYIKTVKLKDGIDCIIRNGTEDDAKAVLDIFKKTHKQTDFLLSYHDEIKFTEEDEHKYLKEKAESEKEIELLAIIENNVVGSAGIEIIGKQFKLSHRAEFGISVDKAYWGFGIGSALTAACIDCAKKAGYSQLELNVVSENEAAVNLYKKFGFIEFGRNPKGFKTRTSGYQEVVYMRLEL